MDEQMVKNWSVRGTMHVFAADDLPLFLHRGRTHYLRGCDRMEGDEQISAQRKRWFAELMLEKIGEGIEAREALREECFRAGLTQREAESVFNSWGGLIRALCESGKISYRVQEKKAFKLCPPFEPLEAEAAEEEMMRRYFTNFGPATVRDVAYFFGTTQANVKKYLSRLPVSAVECDGKTYFYMEKANRGKAFDASGAYEGDIPDCIFLAGFDPLMLGYQKKESLYLPAEYLRRIFNLTGIVMPAVLLHGTVAGRWKKKNNRLLIFMFRSISAEERSAMERGRAAVGRWTEGGF